MAQHNLFGKEGEEIAIAYLRREAYKILHTNWRNKKLELDIVAQHKEMLVIVEVKSRSNDYFEHPKEAVTIKKQKRIVQAADAYIQEMNIDLEARFDIITILKKNGKFDLEHIEDAFQASLL